MRISSINNYETSPSMKAGLYFTKTSSVLFNKDKNVKYMSNEVVKVSKEGSRYIEDTHILPEMKERFAKIPFIRDLAEKFDTFVHFHETSKGERTNQFEHVSYAKVSWADYSKQYAEKREFIGRSPISQELATSKMFMNIENENFSGI